MVLKVDCAFKERKIIVDSIPYHVCTCLIAIHEHDRTWGWWC